MRRPAIRRHLSFANVASALALFVALSTGGAFAASQINGATIKPNSIPATALKNNSITSAKIGNGQVSAADVKRGSLTPMVFNAATQKQLASIGGGGTDPNTNGGGTCADPTAACSPTDVVPSGAGQPCNFLEGTTPNGVWQEIAAGAWLCRYDAPNGISTTTGPAKAGQYSGAVNA